MRHSTYLKKQLENPKFKKGYEQELRIAKMAIEIAKIREELGLSQAELAKKAKLKQQQISAIENGSNTTIKTMFQIFIALGIGINYTHKHTKV